MARVRLFMREQVREKFENAAQCPICFELRPGDMLTLVECGHTLCKQCRSEWAQKSAELSGGCQMECPTCRTTIHREPKPDRPLRSEAALNDPTCEDCSSGEAGVVLGDAPANARPAACLFAHK